MKKGRKSARELNRARILLLANEGRTETEIKDALGICMATVSNVKKRYMGGTSKSSYRETETGATEEVHRKRGNGRGYRWRNTGGYISNILGRPRRKKCKRDVVRTSLDLQVLHRFPEA